jgi:hypothetical protein
MSTSQENQDLTEKDGINEDVNESEINKKEVYVTIMNLGPTIKLLLINIKNQAKDFFNYLVKYFGYIPTAIGLSVVAATGTSFLAMCLVCIIWIALRLLLGLGKYIFSSLLSLGNVLKLIVQSNTYIEIFQSIKQYISLIKIEGFGNWIVNTFNSDILINGVKNNLRYLGNNFLFIFEEIVRNYNHVIEKVIPQFEENIGIIWIIFTLINLALLFYIKSPRSPSRQNPTITPSQSPDIELITFQSDSIPKTKPKRNTSPLSERKKEAQNNQQGKKGGGKTNDIDELLKIFTDEYPGIDEYVDDILQYLIDIIGTIDNSDLEKIGINPQDIRQINVDYIKHIKLNDVKDIKIPEQVFDDINEQIDIIIGQLQDIKAGAEEQVKQMEEMKQSQDNLRYGNEFKQGIMRYNSMGPIGVGAMGGKQKRSRRKHNKGKSGKRKRSRRKRSRRKNRK